MATSGTGPAPATVLGGITSEEEEVQLEELNEWVAARDLPGGQISYDLADPQTGAQRAVLDLAWPDGIQRELTEPVAVLLNETADTISLASSAGFRCFTAAADFQRYVENSILAAGGEGGRG